MSATPATAPLRESRRRLRERLRALSDGIGRLGAAAGEEARLTMATASAELATCLLPHLTWEERIVHPIVDRFACEGPATFSSSMRYEHVVIRRWLDELKDLAAGAEPATFLRRADNLLGVVLAHFELEEEVLFPILDRHVAGGLDPPAGTSGETGASRRATPPSSPAPSGGR